MSRKKSCVSFIYKFQLIYERFLGIKVLAGGTAHLSRKKFKRDLKEQCHKYKDDARISVTKSILD